MAIAYAITKVESHFALTIPREEVPWMQGGINLRQAIGRNERYERPQDGQLSPSLAFSRSSQM
jgi:hypothetical protein